MHLWSRTKKQNYKIEEFINFTFLCKKKNQQLVTEEQKSNSTTVNVKKSPVALLLVNMTGQKPQRANEAQQMSLYHSARRALSPQPRLPWFPLIVFFLFMKVFHCQPDEWQFKQGVSAHF